MRLVDDWLKRSVVIGLVIGALLLVAWFVWQLTIGARVFDGVSDTNLAISGLITLLVVPFAFAGGIAVSVLAGAIARLMRSAPTSASCSDSSSGSSAG